MVPLGAGVVWGGPRSEGISPVASRSAMRAANAKIARAIPRALAQAIRALDALAQILSPKFRASRRL